MATAQDYATWIVQNKDLQGTPEFETVAQAYQVARQRENTIATSAQVPTPRPAERTIGEKLVGAGETALTLGTGLTTGALGGLRGAIGFAAQQAREGNISDASATPRLLEAMQKGAQEFTYAPRGEAGQEQVQAIGRVLGTLPPVLPTIGAPSMFTQATKQAEPIVAAILRRGGTAAQELAMLPVQKGTQIVRDVFGMETPTSAGGARASGGAMATPVEAQRMATAQGLPVPVALTKGAAGREAEQLAFEKEQMKGQLGAPLRQRAEENNLQLLQNFDAIIELTGAEQVRSGIAATGNKLIDTLSQGWEGAKAQTRQAYKKADEAGELNTLMSVDDLAKYINDNKAEATLPNAPAINFAKEKGIELGVLAKLPDGSVEAVPTTLKNTELLRRAISQTTGYDPTNQLFSSNLKKIIDQSTEGLGGELYKQARLLREQQARKFEGRAIVSNLLTTVKGKDDPKIVASEAFQKSILNSSPEEITFLKRVLLTSGKDGQQAWKELQGATVKHLEDVSTAGLGTDSQGRLLVSTAKLNNAINQLDSNKRLDIILGKQNAQVVRDLNDVAKYVTTTPPGTLVNNSGTAGVLLAAMGEAATTGALTGLPLPAISILRAVNQQMKSNKTKARIMQSLNKAETSQ